MMNCDITNNITTSNSENVPCTLPEIMNSPTPKRIKFNNDHANDRVPSLYTFDHISDIENNQVDLSHIKIEVENLDESSYSINTEFTIKEEPCDEITVAENYQQEEVIENSNTIEPIEVYLSKNPELVMKFCGLPDYGMFCALFNFIEVDMRNMPEASKYEQLISVLAKLHSNEDNLHLDKYLFPVTYVNVIQLLYNKLGILRRNIKLIGIPSVFVPMFASSQRVVIIKRLPIKLTGASIHYTVVQYLIGYTAFGDVFFVSKQFSRRYSIYRLLRSSGLLNELPGNCWIVFHSGETVYTNRIDKLHPKKNPVFKQELHSKAIQKYILKVGNRLTDHFKVLLSVFPDYMLHNDNNVCFLDQIVFVCAMILNLSPRCAYK